MTGKENNKIGVYPVEDLLNKDLKIPYYQRPYRWHAEKHVKQLLQDLLREKEIENNSYRLGTILLHCQNEDSHSDIVDGQQRLVTLSLILYAIDDSITGVLNNELDHNDSRNNLKYNYAFIQAYLETRSNSDKKDLKKFILESCNMLVISVTKLGEAFQLFDSQNSRGKALAPADLLKAYHLREMEHVYEDEKRRLVNQWEASIENGQLNDVLGNYLFRLVSWKKNERKYFFSKDDTEVFKGVNPYRLIREGKNYPYINILIGNSASNLYNYDQSIINGKWFFQYISYYLDKLSRIEEICNEKDGLKLNYNGSNRIGDRRLVKLYKNMLFIYLDKFGEDDHFTVFKRLIYRWVFQTRIEKKQIRYETILNKIFTASDHNPIKWIENWLIPDITSVQLKVDSIRRFSKQKEANDKMSNRKRREFYKKGLYTILCDLENSETLTNE